MSRILQEKFETRSPEEGNDDAHGGWITDSEARTKKEMHGREGRPGGDSGSRFSDLSSMFNSLPSGADIEDQENADIRKMGINTAGQMGNSLARGDRSQELDARALRCGFTRKQMRGTDDQYSREHNDAFYDSVEVDGVEGFLERNNNLDRM
jgi:hypothetical protein